jgi:excisionase family DNA binding protein
VGLSPGYPNHLAAYVKLAKSTVYQLAQEGRLPGQKVGRHRRFRRETVDRWLDEAARRRQEERDRE